MPLLRCIQTEKKVRNGSLLSGHILLLSCPLVLILLEIQSNGDLRLSNFFKLVAKPSATKVGWPVPGTFPTCLFSFAAIFRVEVTSHFKASVKKHGAQAIE